MGKQDATTTDVDDVIILESEDIEESDVFHTKKKKKKGKKKKKVVDQETYMVSAIKLESVEQDATATDVDEVIILESEDIEQNYDRHTKKKKKKKKKKVVDQEPDMVSAIKLESMKQDTTATEVDEMIILESEDIEESDVFHTKKKKKKKK